MDLVIIESPYAGNITKNVGYARRCMADSLSRGEAPIASHLIYTQPGILRDHDPDERKHGIQAGQAWMEKADRVVVYTDYGITDGMAIGVERAGQLGIEVSYRQIGRPEDGDGGDPLRPRVSASIEAPEEEFVLAEGVEVRQFSAKNVPELGVGILVWQIEDGRQAEPTARARLLWDGREGLARAAFNAYEVARIPFEGMTTKDLDEIRSALGTAIIEFAPEIFLRSETIGGDLGLGLRTIKPGGPDQVAISVDYDQSGDPLHDGVPELGDWLRDLFQAGCPAHLLSKVCRAMESAESGESITVEWEGFPGGVATVTRRKFGPAA